MSKKQLLISGILFSIFVAVLPTASAQQSNHDKLPPLMKLLDVNKDGILSTNEINAATAVLKRLDTNRDGFLHSKEVLAAGIPESNRRLHHYVMKRDANGDGKLTREELGERFHEMFNQTDKNKDGFLTKAEILKAVDSATSKPVGSVIDEKNGL